MKKSEQGIIKNKINGMITNSNKPILIVLIVMTIMFIFFTVGALSVTVENSKFIESGWESAISWMWIPSLIFLVLSILTAMSMFAKKRS